MLRRRFEGERASLEASNVGDLSSECEDRRRLYIVGTTVRKVIGDFFDSLEGARKGAARRSQTALTLKGKRNSMQDPAKRGVRSAFTVPWM